MKSPANTGIDPLYVDAGKKLDLCKFNTQKDTFDNISIIIEYENHSRAVLQECFTSSVQQFNDREFSLNCWNGQLYASFNTRKVRFYHNNPEKYQAAQFEEIDIPRMPGTHGGADPIMLSYMLDCIINDRPNLKMRGEYGLAAVMVAEAAEIAAVEHRVVELAL